MDGSGRVFSTYYNIKQLCILPTLCICVFAVGSPQKKKKNVPATSLHNVHRFVSLMASPRVFILSKFASHIKGRLNSIILYNTAFRVIKSAFDYNSSSYFCSTIPKIRTPNPFSRVLTLRKFSRDNRCTKLAKTRHDPHSSKLVFIVLFCRYLCCSVVIVLYCCYLCCHVIIYVVLCIFCV